MGENPEEGRYEVVCPHCNREFVGELIGPGTPQAGFKCPHCRLFAPFERVEPPEDANAA